MRAASVAVAIAASVAAMPAFATDEPVDIQIKEAIARCWNVSPGIDVHRAEVTILMNLNRDGTVEAASVVKEVPAGDKGKQVAASALRAVRQCSPFTNLPAARYDDWKEVRINFVPDLGE